MDGNLHARPIVALNSPRLGPNCQLACRSGMKTYQAKALKVGDRIIWSSQSQLEIGVVVERGTLSVKVRWPDSRISELYFNQMQNVERFSFDR